MLTKSRYYIEVEEGKNRKRSRSAYPRWRAAWATRLWSLRKRSWRALFNFSVSFSAPKPTTQQSQIKSKRKINKKILLNWIFSFEEKKVASLGDDGSCVPQEPETCRIWGNKIYTRRPSRLFYHHLRRFPFPYNL